MSVTTYPATPALPVRTTTDQQDPQGGVDEASYPALHAGARPSLPSSSPSVRAPSS